MSALRRENGSHPGQVFGRLDGDPTTAWQTPRQGKRLTLRQEAVKVQGIERR